MNEGEYLEIVNDLKDQYNDMKTALNREIAYYKEKLRAVEILLGQRSQLTYVDGQFASDRPCARMATYDACVPPVQFYMCRRCSKNHPHEYACDL